MRRILLIAMLLVSLGSQVIAQAFLTRYPGAGTTEAVTDPEGYLLLFGTRAIMQPDGSYLSKPCLTKVDSMGAVVWSRSFSGYGAHGFSMKVAANGDYLLYGESTSGPYPFAARVAPDGQVRWSGAFIGGQVDAGQPLGNIADYPGGGAVIVGSNDVLAPFSSPVMQGYVMIIDSTGSLTSFKTYGDGIFVSDEILFYDAEYINGQLLVAARTWTEQGLYAIDSQGMMTASYALPDSIVHAGTTYQSYARQILRQRDGRLFTGFGISSFGSPANKLDVFAEIDTAAMALSGLYLQTGDSSYAARCLATPGAPGEWVYAWQRNGSGATPPKSINYGSAVNGVTTAAYKLSGGSVTTIANSINRRGNRLLLTGFDQQQGNFTLTHAADSLPSLGCVAVTDTVQPFYPFSDTLEAGGLGLFYPQSPDASPYDIITDSSETIYPYYSCGNPGLDCSVADIPLTVTLITDSVLCPGLSAQLTATSPYATIWFGPDLTALDTGFMFATAQPGSYVAVAGNGICFDTSASFNIQFLTVPTPLITQSGDTLITTGGTAYEWLNGNGTSIPGATDSFFTPAVAGTYLVVATYSNGCTAVSSPYLFSGLSVASGPGSPGQGIAVIRPNPTHDVFTIRSYAPLTSIRILDGQGRMLHIFEQPAGDHSYSARSLRLAPGVYPVSFVSGDRQSYAKLVVQ